MRIELDHDFDKVTGVLIGTHFAESDDPKFVATVTAISGNPALQVQAGFAIPTKHSAALPGETRWTFLKRQVNNAPALANLKALNLV